MNQDKLKHRFLNFSKSFYKLKSLAESKEVDALSEIERDSLIKRFEFTYEMSWKLLKDYLEFQGEIVFSGSKDIFRTAFQLGFIHNGDLWMEMVESRILAVHTYDEENAIEISKLIYSEYINLFDELKLFIENQIEN